MKKITAWSYSRYADYEKCPQLCAFKHIDRIKEEENDAMKRGLQVHKDLSAFVASPIETPLPEHAAKFARLMAELRQFDPMLEQQWGFTQDWKATGWFGNDTWFRSVLDVCIVYDDHTSDVIDYKTGKEKEEHKLQAELYAISVCLRHPFTQGVTVRFWYLDHGTESVFRFSKSDVPELIKKWTKRVGPMMKDTIFAPRPGSHCAYCSYSKSKQGPCKYG